MSELEMVELGENVIVEPHRSCVRENSMGIAFIGFIIVGWGITIHVHG